MNSKRTLAIIGLLSLSLSILGSGMNPTDLQAQEARKQDCKADCTKPCCAVEKADTASCHEASSGTATKTVAPACKPAGGKSCCAAGAHGMKMKMNGRATLSSVFSANKLYRCPEHREIISDRSDAACPHHDAPAQLKKMSRRQIKKLRKADLYGCPMCPVVKAEGDGELNCTLCGMDLIKIDEIADDI